MSIKIKKIFVAVFCGWMVTNVASAGVDISNLRTAWGAPEMTTCITTDRDNIGAMAIGRYKDMCNAYNYSIDAGTPSSCKLGDDMGVMLLVARAVNANGARFCPTTVYAEHKKKGNAWTLYAEPAGGQQTCYWLCKPGYSGEECLDTTPKLCDSTPILRSDFDELEMARDPQVENDLPMFYKEVYDGCNVHKGQEHDMILAVSEWLPSGRGVIARPVVVRARREGWKSKSGGPSIKVVGEKGTLLCKTGYTANEENTDCVPINAAMCATGQLCAGWADFEYDSSTMVQEVDLNCVNTLGDYGGIKYKCKEPGYAFASTVSNTCVACVTGRRTGVSPADGTCVTCDVGTIFDADAVTSGYCVSATGYSKQDLQYGRGNSKDSVALGGQCWTEVQTDKYARCVKTGKMPQGQELRVFATPRVITAGNQLQNYTGNLPRLKTAQTD